MAAKKTDSTTQYRNLLQELKNGTPKPVYYLCGEETFYLDRLTDTFSKIIPEHEKDFNFDQLYGQDVNVSRILSIARSYPMMAERRVLIVKNFLLATKGISEGDLNDFMGYLEQPNPTCLLVLIDDKKPAGNTRLGKALKKSTHTGLFEFGTLPDYKIPEWVITWVRSHHQKEIDVSAARLLAQFVGNNLQLLSTEVDKVCTFVDTSEQVTEADVKKIIGSYREYTVIELKDAVLKRDLENALRISEQILQHSKTDTGEIIRLVGFFYSVYTNIWQILRLVESGIPKAGIQQQLGINNNWYFNTLMDDASNYRYSEMPGIFEALLDADKAIKGFSTLDSTSILFLLVRRLAG